MRIAVLNINVSIKWPWLKRHTHSHATHVCIEVNTVNVVIFSLGNILFEEME